MELYKFSQTVIDAAKEAENACLEQFKIINEIQEYNQLKMIKAFQKAGVCESHFAGTTGYGYDDRGREVLDKVYAYAFGAQDALVRHNFVSGTHTLTVALFGILRPGDKMLSVTGMPYDTIRGTIGIEGDYSGSLKDFGVTYSQVELLENGKIDFEGIKSALDEKYKLIYVQRSRGYSLRPSLTLADIEKICRIVREKSPDSVIMIDNCYGEFVEKDEPLSVGADIIAGSLIKNPGGGIAPTGGYIAGRKDLVEMCAFRLTTPGTGKELGATLGTTREMFMGAYHAPFVTGEAIKTAVFAAALFKSLGFEVTPGVNDKRGDIIQVIKLNTPENLVNFCKGIQSGSAVDSFVSPEPWDMPGYEDKVVMAAGAFTMGSSIELSADGPMRAPYAAWMQGGLNFCGGKLGVMLAAEKMSAKDK